MFRAINQDSIWSAQLDRHFTDPVGKKMVKEFKLDSFLLYL